MHHVKNEIPFILISKSTESESTEKCPAERNNSRRRGGDKYTVPHHLHIYPWSCDTWEKHDDKDEDSWDLLFSQNLRLDINFGRLPDPERRKH